MHLIYLRGNGLLAHLEATSLLHRTADVDAEDDRYLIRGLLAGLLLLLLSLFNLCRGFEQVSDLSALRDLFRPDHHFISLIAELADPKLLALFLFD